MKMYTKLADWWPLLSAPAEYADEADLYAQTLRDACTRPPTTVLELGSGGGNNASFLKRRFEMVLVDLAPAMLAVSARLNPECEHIHGDMRTLRLERTFDAVFVHDAICYMLSEGDLRQAIETAWVHCAPGGAALFAPDYVAETFREGTDCGGHDGDDGRAMRYLEWVWDPEPGDASYVADYTFTLREADGSVRVEHERHVEGLHSRQAWLRLLREAGFEPEVRVVEHEGWGPAEVFVARRP